MNWLGVARVAIDVWRLASERPAPPWRWGHAFEGDSLICFYCRQVVPSREKHTNPECPGPSAARAKEIRARKNRHQSS